MADAFNQVDIHEIVLVFDDAFQKTSGVDKETALVAEEINQRLKAYIDPATKTVLCSSLFKKLIGTVNHTLVSLVNEQLVLEGLKIVTPAEWMQFIGTLCVKLGCRNSSKHVYKYIDGKYATLMPLSRYQEVISRLVPFDPRVNSFRSFLHQFDATVHFESFEQALYNDFLQTFVVDGSTITLDDDLNRTKSKQAYVMRRIERKGVYFNKFVHD